VSCAKKTGGPILTIWWCIFAQRVACLGSWWLCLH